MSFSISFDLSVSKHPAKQQEGHRSEISFIPYYTNRYTNPLGQHSFHCGSRLVTHSWRYVTVAVQGHGYSGMPKKLLYQLGVMSSAQKQCRARVAEVVEADVGQPCLL